MTSQYHYGIYSQNRAAERHILHIGNAFWCKNFNGFHTGMAVGQKEVVVWFLTSSPALAPS